MYKDLIKALRNVDEYDSGYAKLMYDAADAIEELSRLHEAQRQNLITLMNEEPEPKWIPVTERLPEEKDSGFSADVLIVVKERDGDFTWKDVYSGYYFYDAVGDEIGWWAQMPQDCQQIKEGFSVTHWMPLPEPPDAPTIIPASEEGE